MKSLNFYWRLTRPHTLTASLIPVLAGISFATSKNLTFRPILAITLLLCAVIIQIATNLFNEYYDYLNGLDTKDSVGIGGAIVKDGINPNTILLSAIALFVCSGILGLILALFTSFWLLPIGVLCLLIAYCYTGGPYPISRTPFGELFAGTLMGSGLFLIAFFTQTGFLNWYTLIVSIPLNILIGLLLTANSLRDRVADAENGRKTLAILLGHDKTVLFMIFFLTFVYVWLFVLLVLNESLFILLPCLTIPLAIKSIKAYKDSSQTPKQMMTGMIYYSKLNQQFGILYTLAFIMQYIIAIM